MGLLGIPSLVVGIIFLAGPTWFSGQHTVGVVLTVVSAVIIIWMLVVAAGITAAFRKLQ